MNKYNYDVVVCGGGIAGVAAALSAARNGAKTCLLEKEYALGGLATLGLIVIYLPLCDGDGVQMSGGIAEEFLKLSVKYGPGDIPKVWTKRDSTKKERAKKRYLVQYNAASLMIALEERLLSENVDIFYDARISGVKKNKNDIKSVIVETKMGRIYFQGKAFIDTTGDGDVCFFSKEKTVDDSGNRKTGWYYSYDKESLKLNKLSDPLTGEIPKDSRLYSGTLIEDISQHCIDSRKMILHHIKKKREDSNKEVYPLIIPSIPGFRMTRRLVGSFEFSEDKHERCWFSDSIGMIGNWKRPHLRYSIPYRSIKGVENDNLFVAGRCCSADKSGWDLIRVIPTCAITGEAAGTSAAMFSKGNKKIDINVLQKTLKDQGVLLNPDLFTKTI